MKILWVKADKLLPVQNGGNIRSYHIARHLAERHDLTFLSYYGGPPDSSYEADLNREFPGAVTIATRERPMGVLQRGVDYLYRLPARAPYAVSRFASPGVRARLESWFGERRSDVVVCDFLDAAVNFPSQRTIPTVLFQHNVETEIWRRHVLTESSRLKKLFYGVEFMKMLAYERKAVAAFHHVIAVSENDRRLMAGWVEDSRISVVPTGVDLSQFRPGPTETPFAPLVVFVGAMDWEPNIDAVEYFLSEIWSAVEIKVPEARFRIVGRNPPLRVRRLASRSVEVTGSVPSVVEHLREAAVVVVPLRIGGGTRLKIYEAMAAGKAVVSTSVGAEGLDVHAGRDILLADTAPAFAEAVLAVLGDPGLRERLKRAAPLTAASYDWAVAAARFGEVLERLARDARPDLQAPRAGVTVPEA